MSAKGKRKAQVTGQDVRKAFGFMAGKIVDTMIEWKPGQVGRWDVRPGVMIDRIVFSGFEPNTKLVLKSMNGSQAELSLEACALAISECAWNWISWQAHEAGFEDIGRAAAKNYHVIHEHIYSKSCELPVEEKVLIARVND